MNINKIKQGQAILSAAYPGRFEVSDATAGIWLEMLSDIKPSAYQAAIYQLVMVEKQYPPNIALVRETAINLQYGDITVLSAEQAWTAVQEYKRETRIQRSAIDAGGVAPERKMCLSAIAEKALHNIGGWWQLANSTNPGMDRASFIKAYNQFAEAQRIARVTSPRVSTYADSHVPRLEEHVAAETQLLTPAAEYPTQDEIRKMVATIKTIGE